MQNKEKQKNCILNKIVGIYSDKGYKYLQWNALLQSLVCIDNVIKPWTWIIANNVFDATLHSQYVSKPNK